MSEELNKQEWVELFRETGLDDAMMDTWHRLFESRHPQAHQNFLEWLNIPADEITDIRNRFK